ncbi:hypothetical protein RND81_07G128700 [Saponaria officinalis]|uniref:non-specific serine/threonine protein kinase n=1 Tax=Saponaria officinalis TaxID=3572 RepID=A0AAW1JTK8_SAPOF
MAWYEECIFRYAEYNIFSISESGPGPGVADCSDGQISNITEFEEILDTAMTELINNTTSSTSSNFASSKMKFGSHEHLYSFVQCTPDISRQSCRSCLYNALLSATTLGSECSIVMIFYESCQLRYNTTGPFLTNAPSTPNTPPALPPSPAPSRAPVIAKAPLTRNKTSSNVAVIAAIAVCASVGLLALCAFFCVCLFRKKPTQASRDGPPKLSAVVLLDGGVKSDVDGLGETEFEQYNFKTLRIATKDFSDENMLGEGGFGIVYKGTLKNGQQLAIKRLSGGTSGQGTKEFMTEARILAKLQHRNLVKLVGFCSERDEKLLVYEFMSNSSLDRFLFDPLKQPLLDWITRKTITVGIARGLQYLHEDSRLTIIHRDLKPGNILLDNEMTPKIADFGLAKLFERAQKFGNTIRIAGTQGYMAPEYLTTGDYSDKSDVYSYGIMLLEIISGQKNRMSRQTPPKEDLSIQAWRLWNEERSFEITDPILLDNCPRVEVLRNIQIGLLCVQPNAEERPPMTAVVLMLTCAVDLPFPAAPIMSSAQFNMPMNYSGTQQSSVDRSSTKSVTRSFDVTHALHPIPR